jgi:hypothetical protein
MSRKKAASWVHQYLRPYLQKTKKILIPEGKYLSIRAEIHNIPEKANWDVSNKWPWIKWFEDTLVELKKIPDDSIQYVRDSGRITFIETATEAEKKIVFSVSIY